MATKIPCINILADHNSKGNLKFSEITNEFSKHFALCSSIKIWVLAEKPEAGSASRYLSPRQAGGSGRQVFEICF